MPEGGGRSGSGLTVHLAAVVLAALLASCGATAPGPAPAGSPSTARPTEAASPTPTALLSPTPTHPCGLAGPGPPLLQHVVLIVMENRSYQSVVGPSQAPYINRLASQCGLATNYQAVAHPSLPNYIALTSGGTQGISDDGPPAANPVAAPSIFSLLGGNWRSLEESMPSNCAQQSSGEYAVKHNPAAYYTGVAPQCAGRDVALVNPPNISAAFTLITPNVCDDMHDCSTATGDTWLAREVPLLLTTAQYSSGNTAIFITWDESDGSTQQVPTLVIAPTVPAGIRVATAYTHYSLLRTIEQLLQLSPLLGQAATATSMASGFNL